MIEKNKISKLSIKNLQSIKDLTVQDIENIINTKDVLRNTSGSAWLTAIIIANPRKI